MAMKLEEKNGDPIQETSLSDVKIIVVGDEGCGKTKFIEAFAERPGNNSGVYYMAEFSRVYQCKYEIQGEPKDIKIFEIRGGPDYMIKQLTDTQFDANGIVFMYAIDDPSNFQRMKEKWFKTLTNNSCWNFQPTILVGNKRDLRDNQQVIQRLARDNQTLVTEEQGKNLAKSEKINEFYECSSIDEDDLNIHNSFHYILSEGLINWRINNSLM